MRRRALITGVVLVAVASGFAFRAHARRADQAHRDERFLVRDSHAKRAESGDRASALEALRIDHELRAPPTTDRLGLFHAAFTTPDHGLVRDLGISEAAPFITAGGDIAAGSVFYDLKDGGSRSAKERAPQTTIPRSPYRAKDQAESEGSFVHIVDRRGRRRFRLPHAAPVAAFSPSWELSLIAVATADKKLTLWDLDWEETPMAVISVDEVPATIEIAVDGTRLVTSDRDHRVRLYDITVDGAVVVLCRSFPDAPVCR